MNLRLAYFFIALSLCVNLNAQSNETIPPVSLNLEVGYVGVWISAEKFVQKRLLLRGELGLEGQIFKGSIIGGSGFTAAPAINLETRYFFSFRELKRNLAVTKNYRGTFLSIKAISTVGSLSFSNRQGIGLLSYTHLFPNFGIIRPIGGKGFYQLGFGYGPTFFHAKENNFLNDLETNVLIRFGVRLI